MSLLVINNLPKNNEYSKKAIKILSEKTDKIHVLDASDLNIKSCIGCKTCMFKTPGVCCLQDDYKAVETLLFEYSNIIVISGTSLNFLDHRTIRLFERRFPWAVVFCEYRNQKIRHVRRYNNQLRIGILYTGTADNRMMNDWLDLYTDHGNDISLGAFHIDDVEEICKCILQ